MSTLRSALDELRVEDLRSLSDAALGADIDELERAGRIVEAERGRRLAEFERRKAYASDGHVSASAWLAHRQGLSRSVAEGQVRRARRGGAHDGVRRPSPGGGRVEDRRRPRTSARGRGPPV